MNRWKKSKTTIYNVTYHIIWCPKYRRRILEGEVEIRLRELLLEKAGDLGITIETMEIMPDHVHLFVKAGPTLSIQFIVNQLKGYSSHVLRSEIPSVKSRLPSLWTRSYYVETIGHISEETIIQYIEDQKSV